MTRDRRGHVDSRTRAKAVARYAAGETSDVVGRSLGVAGASVLSWVRASGGTVRQRQCGRRRQYPADVVARAVARYRDGEGSLVIARELGCSDCSVREWVRDAGVPIRRPTGYADQPPRPRLVRSEDELEDHEHGARVPRLLPVPDPSEGEVTIRLVRDDHDGSVRLVARTLVVTGGGAPQVEQRSWDAEAADQWPRGLLALLASAVAPREKTRREARYGE